MDSQKGKSAIFIVLFLMSLNLHIQFPIFTPYAVALGASSFFISLMMSGSSFANLGGNVIAGPFIDRIGKKPFIVVPLFLSAFLMAAHAAVDDPLQLMFLRIANGFALAFLSPACFALLSAYAKTSRQQGKNMAVNGIMITFANIAAPFIGGHLVHYLNYRGTYVLIGILMAVSAVIALYFIKEMEPIVPHRKEKASLAAMIADRKLYPVYFIGFALMFGQGTLFYELPFLSVEQGLSTTETGKLFSLMGIGTFASFSLFWLNRFSPLLRTAAGMLFSALLYFQLASGFADASLGTVLFLLGAAFGLLFPALTTLLTEKVGKERHGSAFGLLSAVLSAGIIFSSLTAGSVRDFVSPYYAAFLVSIAAVVYIVYDYLGDRESATPATKL
ncbi:MAG TPA: MFS transporter [Bacillales bacterium]|nr:MFS transporter [Bacillales bacterium]